MQQTISQAARLYGKARSTIHRAIDAGRLSCTVRGDGVRVVDLSELIRMWGEPPNAPAPTQQNATAENEATQQPTQQAMLDELRALRQEVRELKEAMLLLPAPNPTQPSFRPSEEAPPEPPNKPPQGEQAATPTDDDPHGFRSLVRALRDSEQ